MPGRGPVSQSSLTTRPEELVLEDRGSGIPGPAGMGRLAGTLVKSTFTGPLVSYAVDCGSGLTLVAERHRPAASDLLPVGSAVEVVVPEGAVFAFDAETGARV